MVKTSGRSEKAQSGGKGKMKSKPAKQPSPPKAAKPKAAAPAPAKKAPSEKPKAAAKPSSAKPSAAESKAAVARGAPAEAQPGKPAPRKETATAAQPVASPSSSETATAEAPPAPPSHARPEASPPARAAMPSIAVKPAAVIRPAVTGTRSPAGASGPGLRLQHAGLRPGAKAPAKVQRYKDLQFKPRFAYGEMASLAEICGAGFGTEMGFGIVRFTKARIPWAIKYDEVLMVLSGVLRVRTGGRVLEAGPHDSIWLPAGTELIYEADDALVAYSVHPIGATPSSGSRS